MSPSSVSSIDGHKRPPCNRSIENKTEQPAISATTVTPLVETPIRPSASSIPTSSSTSSNESSHSAASIFDPQETPSERSTSPITPPDESIDSPIPCYPLRTIIDFAKPHPYVREPTDNNDCPKIDDDSIEESEIQKLKGSKHDSGSESPSLYRGQKSGHESALKSHVQDQQLNDPVAVAELRRSPRGHAGSTRSISLPRQKSSKRNIPPSPPIDTLAYLPAPSTSESQSVEKPVSEENTLPEAGIPSPTEKSSVVQQDLPVDDSHERWKIPGKYPQDWSPVSDIEKSETMSNFPREPDSPSVVQHKTRQVTPPLRKSKNTRAEGKYPDFKPWKEKKEAPEIKKSVCKRILEGINVKEEDEESQDDQEEEETTNQSPKPGWIYVYTHTLEHEVHLKIGKTDRSIDERFKEWKKCEVPLELKQNEDVAFEFCGIVEKLVALELHNQRRIFACKRCKKQSGRKSTTKANRGNASKAKEDANLALDDSLETSETRKSTKRNHIEWYSVDLEEAKKIICKWRNWVILQKPFNKQGKLTGYWKWRVGKAKKTDPEKMDWEKWTQPPKWEKYIYLIKAYHDRHGTLFWSFVVINTLLSYIFWGRVNAVFTTVAVLVISYQ